MKYTTVKYLFLLFKSKQSVKDVLDSKHLLKDAVSSLKDQVDTTEDMFPQYVQLYKKVLSDLVSYFDAKFK